MAHLAIDLLGGDKGSAHLLAGVFFALEKQHDLVCTLFGDLDQDQIPSGLRSRVNVLRSCLAVDMIDQPVTALRKKTDSSMAQAIRFHADKSADAVVSCGNTSVLVGFGMQILGLQKGVSRPAIAALLPTSKGKTWLLDVGATLNLSVSRLLELAAIGAALSRAYDGVDSPVVRVLNVGAEESKGSEQIKGAAETMSESKHYDFAGNVEGDQIFLGNQNVVVCDGFSGNIAIKTAQGISRFLERKYKEVSASNLFNRVIFGLLSPVLKKIADRADPALYNGAPLLGLNGLIVKSHGSADKKAFANAILIAAEMAERELVAAINNSLEAQVG